jgi:hypothetical protein
MSSTYSVPYFKELVTTYPSFEEVRRYCEQNHVRVIDGTNRYAILRYDKAFQTSQTLHDGFFRSLVWDTVTNRPVCVAPPKACEQASEQAFVASEQASSTPYRCEEFLEGVMVNAFLDASGTVQLATRSKMGATGIFYSRRSFQDLLVDALQQKGIATIQGIKQILGIHTFASFLLQHPEHRIVSKITVPSLYLIHRGSVSEDGTVILQEVNDGAFAIPTITVPVNTSPEALVIQLAEQRGWQWQGLVFKDGHGSRWRLRSKAYTMVRTLRGESPRQDVQFLNLRSKGMMETYLYYYPEEKDAMWDLEGSLRNLTHTLYQQYVTVHIKHQRKFAELPPFWKPHVFSLHSLFLGTLKQKGHFIRKQEVIQYMNHLPIPRVLHLFKSVATL